MVRSLHSENYNTLIKDREIRNQHKQVERHTVLMDWKIYCCSNSHTTQSNRQIQGKLHQNTKGIFQRTRTNNLKICMETQKTLSSQSNLEKQQNWRCHTS